MLENFDQAKAELTDIRNALAKHIADEGTKTDLDFLKARALDRLRDIYVDSKSTIDHIHKTFENATTTVVLSIIDTSLQVPPPFRRALSSEEDGKTVQALVDAAVWKSRFVWLFSWTAGALILITLAALGYTVVDLNKQADKAREAISQAREKAQDEIGKMNKSVDEIGRNTAEIESTKKAIDQNFAALEKRLGNPNDEVNRVTLRFGSELIRLSDLEQEWARRREKISADLMNHVTFLTGEEDKVSRKKSEFEQLISQHTAAIEPLAKDTLDLEAKIAAMVETSRRGTESFDKQINALQVDADTIHTLREKSENIDKTINENVEKIAAAQRDVEDARNEARTGETELRQSLGGVKAAIEKLSKSVETEQNSFEEHARVQRKGFDDATTAAQKGIEGTTGDVNRIAAQAIVSLNSTQANASQYLQTIGTAREGAVKQATETARISNAVSQLQTDITTKFESLKTDEQRLKGERERAKIELDKVYEIINIVEDKRSDVGEKLHKMLDEKPSLDSATAWKLVLASNVLLALCGAIVLLLLALVGVLVVLIRGRPSSIDASQVPS